jgi:hypothetical protein
LGIYRHIIEKLIIAVQSDFEICWQTYWLELQFIEVNNWIVIELRHYHFHKGDFLCVIVTISEQV